MFSLKDKHTLALNSSCWEFIQIQTTEDLRQLKSLTQNVFILGAGSNVGFVDNYEGQVISFVGKDINIIEQKDRWLIEVEAGVNWHKLVIFLIEKGIPGLENLALIPGNCGAAPVQNIGAYGCEFSDYCHEVYATDLRTREQHILRPNECQFGYRNSVFKSGVNKDLLITKVVLSLSKTWKAKLTYKGLDTLPDKVTAKDVMNKVIQIRQSKLPDPSVLANAGSFFKNPVITKYAAEELRHKYVDMPLFPIFQDEVKLSAGWLIEKAGFKGLKDGEVGTYDKHALVVVNYHNASGANLLNFVRTIRDKVYEVFRVKLENEVLLMGRDGLVEL